MAKLSTESLRKRIRAKIAKEQEKSAADEGSDVKDPNEKGVEYASPDPAESAEKQTTPSKEQPTSTASESLENKGSGVAGNENADAPSHKDGTAEDERDVKKMASAILDRIKKDFNKTASDCESGKKGEEAKEEDKVEKTTTEEDKDASKTAREADKSADIQFTDDFHRKIGSVMLSTEEGREHLSYILRKSMAAEDASNLIKQASQMEKIAREQYEAEQYGIKVAQDIMSRLSPEQRETFVKVANMHASNREEYKTEHEKLAYDQGAADAAAMAEAGGQLPPLPEAGAEPSPEELLMILDQLVQSGQIPPEVAEMILQEILGGGAPMDPAAAGGAPMDPAAAAAPMPVEEPIKAASEKTLSDKLLESL